MQIERRTGVSIFCWYSQKDEELAYELEMHLSVLQRQGLITAWYDHQIDFSKEEGEDAKSEINKAQIILLLISPDFMASDYQRGREMAWIMANHRRVRIIPILLRPTNLEGTPFEEFQQLPLNGPPVTEWSDPDEAFYTIAKTIRRVIEDSALELSKRRGKSLALRTDQLKLEVRGNKSDMIYYNLDIIIGLATSTSSGNSESNHQYPVAAFFSEGGEAHTTMYFPFDRQALSERLKQVEEGLYNTSADMQVFLERRQAIQEFGKDLFEMLFSGEVQTLYERNKQHLNKEKGERLRIRLRIQPAELAALPWEFLYDPKSREYLCLDRRISLVRYQDLHHPYSPLVVEPPLRILGMVSLPKDSVELNVRPEKNAIRKQLQSLRKKVKLNWSQGATWDRLRREMNEGHWHIFHFIGHGKFNEEHKEGAIIMVDSNGNSMPAEATNLSRLLNHPYLRLVVLNACEGARADPSDCFSSTASILAQKNIPAIVAMQYKVTNAASIKFARAFYETLIKDKHIDSAITEARLAMAGIPNSMEWGALVLHMRSRDGILFELIPEDTTTAAALALQDEEDKLPLPLGAEDQDQVGDLVLRATTPVDNLESDQLEAPGQYLGPTLADAHLSTTTTELPLKPVQLPPPWIRSRPLYLVVVGLLLLAILSGVFLLTRPPSPITPTTLCLATDLPENGTQAAQGRGIRHGVELALKQSAMFSATYHGYHLTEFVMDDSSNGGDPDPVQGEKNLTDLPHAASCPNPIAVIGPYNSSVAQKEIPVAAKNHILLLSPSNTAPCLTKPDLSVPDCSYDQIHPQGFPNTYARLPGTDIDRGYLSAEFLVNAPNSTNPAQGGLGAQKIEIVGDENIAGTQVAQALVKALRQKGITPSGIDCIKLTADYNEDHFCSQLSPNTEAFSMDNIGALAAKIQGTHPDAVFFGGLNIQGAGLLLKDLRELGLDNVSFVGTGGAFIAQAGTFFGTIGSHVTNVYTIIAGSDPSTFTSGAPATFSQQYQSEFGTPPEPLSAGGYDAANVVIKAIEGLIDKGKPVTKESIVEAVLSGTFAGVTSNNIHFDQHGDNIGQRVYTLYQSQQQSQNTWNWKFLTQRITG